MAVILLSFASMIGMGKAIYGLNKRLAVAEAPHPESAKCDPYNRLSEFELPLYLPNQYALEDFQSAKLQ